jgi:hypothetical protein
MLIRFVKDPTGKYNLCYEIGEEKDFPDAQAMDMIEDGYAVPVQVRPENAASKVKKEKR